MTTNSFTPLPAPVDAWSAMPSATPQLTLGSGDAHPMYERLLSDVQNGYDASKYEVAKHLHHRASGSLSTLQMLDLQADMINFSVRVQFTTNVAEKISHAIDNLTQK